MKSLILFLFFTLSFHLTCSSQFAIPYSQNFDVNSTGWTHYAISGTDVWAVGIPGKPGFDSAYTAPNAWVTSLTSNYPANSIMCLQSPAFDFSDTSTNYYLSFYYKLLLYLGTGGVASVEYSTDGSNWYLLNGTFDEKKDWYNTASGFTYSDYISFKNPNHSLEFLKGQPNVIFRFKLTTNSLTDEGWMIDNFEILPEFQNAFPIPGDTIKHVSQYFPDVLLTVYTNYINHYEGSFVNTMKFYISNDNILSVDDTLVLTNTETSWGSYSNQVLTTLIALPSYVHPGNWYALFTMNEGDSVLEGNYNDNIGQAVIQVDSTYASPLADDIEGPNEWSTYVRNTYGLVINEASVWKRAVSTVVGYEGAISDSMVWTTQGNPPQHNNQYLLSPFITLDNDSTNVVCFWFKTYDADPGPPTGHVAVVDSFIDEYWLNGYGLGSFSKSRTSDWDCVGYSIPPDRIRRYNKISINTFMIYGFDDIITQVIDNIYIGPAKPDLIIQQNDKMNYFTSSSFSTDTLFYQLWNSGLVAPSTTQTEFFWSTDSIFDVSDVSLGIKPEASLSDTSFEKRFFAYTKQNNVVPVYYIFYVLDVNQQLDEMFEGNDTGYFKIQQQQAFTLPYFNDFESQINGWSHNASIGNDDWQWDVPQGAVLNHAFSGIKAWNSNAYGDVSYNSRMHLFTPVIDLSSASNPVIEFDMENVSDGSCSCFAAKSNLSYSVDGGAVWQVLDTGSYNSFKNWYYWLEWDDYGFDIHAYQPVYSNLLFQPTEKCFVPSTYYQGRDADRTTHYVVDAKKLMGYGKVQFRFNLATRENDTNEGAVIDNFTIRESFTDLLVPYTKMIMTSSLSSKVQFFIHLKNVGNYISPITSTKFYLSTDSTLSGNDAYVGEYITPAIRPDMKQYINFTGTAPVNQQNYHYLIYSLDANNEIAESDETNNKGYWKFVVDSVIPLPYFNDFSDTIINGWYEKTVSNLGYEHRFRNTFAPNDQAHGTNSTSGMWFTDQISNVLYDVYVPDLYLYSPPFSFKMCDSVALSFNLMCAGSTLGSIQEGGNMQYATDGDTYTVMQSPPGGATNWYNSQILSELSEAGWGDASTFTPTTYNASYLRGDSSVIFRYHFNSNVDYTPGFSNQGFWLDNFRVEGYLADYFAVDTGLVINAGSAPQIDVTYHILNDGQTNGRFTTVKFYWSPDSIFDATDSLINSVEIDPIGKGTLQALVRTIASPQLAQPTYYLFYRADAGDDILEINEQNNTGYFKVTYDNTGIAANESQNISAFLSQNNLIVDVTNLSQENAVLEFENLLGGKIFSSTIQLLPGKNHFEFPQRNLSRSIYFVMIRKVSENYVKKLLAE